MDFRKPLDYMHAAKHAGKVFKVLVCLIRPQNGFVLGHMAWEKKFEHEAELGALEEARGARQAAYTPVFYTAVQEHVPVVQGQHFRSYYS